MITSLINAKFGLPAARSGLVPRRRLIDRLHAGIHGKLSLISAPAGYGKTTLAAEWLREIQRPVAWLSLDEADNDPARFLSYFLAALQIIDPDFGTETRSLLQAPEPPSPELLTTTLLNELTAFSKPYILALDDFQVIQTLATHRLLNAIVERQPRQMHLLLITREDPPLSLPRLRARGQLTEIRQADLRFSPDECADFLENVAGLRISPNEIAALERRTEGWAAGLQLAALSMQGRQDIPRFLEEFTGSSRYVLDFLAQEVFERQSQEVQDFLLRTSILDQLCASLCEAVTGQPANAATLEALEHANLFIIPLDQSRTWYRYHRLFRDVLRSRLRAQGVSTWNALHRRAAAWYQRHDLIAGAVEHALSGEDWETALNAIASIGDGMAKNGETFTLLNWYNRIPEELIRGDAQTCIDYSWSLMLSSQFERARIYLSLAEGLAAADPGLLGQLYNAQAHLARAKGDNRRMVELSQKALSLLPEQDLDARCMASINLGIAYWHAGKMDLAGRAMKEAVETGQATGNHFAVSTAFVFQGMVMAVRGKLHAAHDRFQTVIQREQVPSFILGLAYLYRSVLYYEWNELEQSGKVLLEAVKIAERVRHDELLVAALMVRARIHLAAGNRAAARDALDKAHQKVVAGQVTAQVLPRLAAAWVHVAVACEDTQSASDWAGRMEAGSDWHSFARFTNTTRALYLLSQRRTAEAAGDLELCFEQASEEGWAYSLIAIRSLQALAASNTEAAFEFFQEALQWAQPEGFIRIFVDLGEQIEPLLQLALRRRVMPDYAGKLLSALQDKSPLPALARLSLVEPLNPRELEVIRLVAAGYTNRQIAGELVISIGTAKTHVHNICGKLGSRNRTEAAARARELGLV